MESIKKVMESCGSDVQAMADMVDVVAEHGTPAEYTEASGIFRKTAIKRSNERLSAVAKLLLK